MSKLPRDNLNLQNAKPSEKELAKPESQVVAKPSGTPKPGSLESILAKRPAKTVLPLSKPRLHN